MAIFITRVNTHNLAQTIKGVDMFNAKARLATEKALHNGTRRVAASARRRVAVKSGLLKSKISSSFKADGLVGYVRAKAPHAHLIEFGAKGSVAFPKKAKVLKIPITEGAIGFFSDKERQQGYAFRKKAVIPPRSPHPFMIPAFEEQEPRIVSDVKKGIESAKVT